MNAGLPPEPDHADQGAQALVAAARAHLDAGELNLAWSGFQQAIEAAIEENSRKLEAQALWGLGRTLSALAATEQSVWNALATHGQAVETLEEALAIARKLDRANGAIPFEHAVLLSLANASLDAGEPAQACSYHRQALELSGSLKDWIVGYRGLMALGGIYHQVLLEPETALPYFRRAAHCAHAAADPRAEWQALSSAAGALRAAGRDPDEVIRTYRSAIALAHDNHHPAGEQRLLRELGDTYLELYGTEEYARAMACYERALALARAAGDHTGTALLLQALGRCYRLMGEPARALEAYQGILESATAVEDPWGQIAALDLLAETHLAAKDSAAALACYERRLALATSLGDSQGVGRAHLGIARAHELAHALELALEHYREALKVLGLLELEDAAPARSGIARLEARLAGHEDAG